MYNRYIPGPDGSYRKNRMQESISQPQSRPQPALNQSKPDTKAPPLQQAAPEYPVHTQTKSPRPEQVGSFIKNLIPKDFDTADLIIVLLLLLMAGDCAEDQNTALLTLALYFFI